MNITLENIKTAISNATIDGNFNSDLIENALVIEQSSEYILGKFYAPTFEDKPYFTIGHFQDSYFGGHYDMNLIDATNDFVKRNQ